MYLRNFVRIIHKLKVLTQYSQSLPIRLCLASFYSLFVNCDTGVFLTIGCKTSLVNSQSIWPSSYCHFLKLKKGVLLGNISLACFLMLWQGWQPSRPSLSLVPSRKSPCDANTNSYRGAAAHFGKMRCAGSPQPGTVEGILLVSELTAEVPHFIALLYCALQILAFLKQIEGLWKPCVQQVYQGHVSNSTCLLCVPVLFW